MHFLGVLLHFSGALLRFLGRLLRVLECLNHFFYVRALIAVAFPLFVQLRVPKSELRGTENAIRGAENAIRNRCFRPSPRRECLLAAFGPMKNTRLHCLLCLPFVLSNDSPARNNFPPVRRNFPPVKIFFPPVKKFFPLVRAEVSPLTSGGKPKQCALPFCVSPPLPVNSGAKRIYSLGNETFFSISANFFYYFAHFLNFVTTFARFLISKHESGSEHALTRKRKDRT